MLELIFAFLLGLASPAQSTNNSIHSNTTTIVDQDDTGGEGGHIPPRYP